MHFSRRRLGRCSSRCRYACDNFISHDDFEGGVASMSAASRGSRYLLLARCADALGIIALTSQPLRADALLEEIVEFTGQILFIESGVPALVIGAVRDVKSWSVDSENGPEMQVRLLT